MQGEQGDFFYFIDCGNYDIDIHVRIGLPIGQTRALRCATGRALLSPGRLAHSTLRQRCTAATHSASKAVPCCCDVRLHGCSWHRIGCSTRSRMGNVPHSANAIHSSCYGTGLRNRPARERLLWRIGIAVRPAAGRIDHLAVSTVEYGVPWSMSDQPRAASIISRWVRPSEFTASAVS